MKKLLIPFVIVIIASPFAEAKKKFPQDLTIKFMFPELNYSRWYVKIPSLTEDIMSADYQSSYTPAFRFQGGDMLGIGGLIQFKHYWLIANTYTSKGLTEYFHLTHTAYLTRPEGSKIYVWDYKDLYKPMRTDKTYQITAIRNIINLKFGVFILHRLQPYIYYSQFVVRTHSTLNTGKYSNIVVGNKEEAGWDISPFEFDYNSLGIGSSYDLIHSDEFQWKVDGQISPLGKSKIVYFTNSGYKKYSSHRAFEMIIGTKIYWKFMFIGWLYELKRSYTDDGMKFRSKLFTAGVTWNLI